MYPEMPGIYIGQLHMLRPTGAYFMYSGAKFMGIIDPISIYLKSICGIMNFFWYLYFFTTIDIYFIKIALCTIFGDMVKKPVIINSQSWEMVFNFTQISPVRPHLVKKCTRDCRFCAVTGGNPRPLEASEPARVARAVKELGLSHVVVTSVTRDDLPDGGAQHFASTITAIRAVNPHATVEVLVPDFAGSPQAISVVLAAKPDIFNHNLETVPRLYRKVRPQANYRRSLALLKAAKKMGHALLTKSGMMLGLGESEEELLAVMRDLRRVDCDLLTLGQYLPPSEDHLPVARFVAPEEFARLAAKGKEMGFRGVAAGPFVRGSYRAEELFQA
jgi:lipoic acid synthetase